MTDPAVAQLAQQVASLQREVDALKRGQGQAQLTNAAVDRGSITFKDGDNALARVGWQADGALAVTYVGGDRPPTPTSPLVSEREGYFVIAWNGNLVTGTLPSNVVRIDAHMSEDPSFTPDGSTYVGSIPTAQASGIVGGGGVVVPSDADTKYICLVAVTNANVASLPSNVVDATVIPLSNLAIATLTTAELNLLGKITSGVSDGQRLEFSGAQGLQGYDGSGNLWLSFDQTTATGLIVGELRTAQSGQRILINPFSDDPDTIRFYPDSGSKYASITGTAVSGQAGILLSANSDRGDGAAAFLRALPLEAGLFFGNPESGSNVAGITLVETTSRFRAPVVSLETDSQYSTGDGNGHRVAFSKLDGSGGYITGSQLYYRPPASDAPSLVSDFFDVSLIWGAGGGALYVRNAADSGYKAIKASAFDVNSSAETKEDIRDLPPATVRQIVRNAPAKLWRRIGEQPTYAGPMAEDVPAWMRRPDQYGSVGLDMLTLIGLLWRLCQDLDERVDTGRDLIAGLQSRVAALESR